MFEHAVGQTAGAWRPEDSVGLITVMPLPLQHGHTNKGVLAKDCSSFVRMK